MAYYWYLAFGDQPEVRALASRCQDAVAAPHFDLVTGSELHMTLERVAFAEDIDAERLQIVQRCTDRLVEGFGPLHVTIGPLAGSTGALSFSAEPRDRLGALRSLLVSANEEFGVPVESETQPFRPHVGIAYCNRSVDARRIIAQVEALRGLPRVKVCIREALLVALTRNERSYSWTAVHRAPLVPAPESTGQDRVTKVRSTDPPSSTSNS
jgi:2'-5' RNA ligase